MNLLRYFIALIGRPTATEAVRRARSEIQFDPGPTILTDINVEWEIVYQDRDDEQTERRITVRSVHGSKYPKYIKAYCHLRNEERHFNLYNILKGKEAETGSPIPQRVNDIPAWINGHEQRLMKISNKIDIQRRKIALIIRTRDGATFDVTVNEAFVKNGTSAIRGRAVKQNREGERKWAGQKTFYSHMCEAVFSRDTGEIFADINEVFSSIAKGQDIP